MPGQLFTHYFLTDGIKSTPEWRTYVDQSETFAKFRTDIRHLYDSFSGYEEPNEAVTEQNLIRPILELLGWVDYLPQQGASRNEDIPDHLLFADRESVMRAAAKKKPHDRFRDALAVEESKRFGRALDARDQHGQTKAGTPHGQILRYLSTAEIVSDNRIRWGILTNGGVWRLYDYRARPRASGYFEAELAEMLKPDNEERLRLFHLLFRRDSFTLMEGATSTFLERALAEGKRYEEQVAQDLSGIVFESAFPKLVEALAVATGDNLPRVRQSALIFLYRLLFVLYAEDRNLLPVNDLRYDDYGLRKRVRDDIARRMADGDVYSSVASNYYDRLVNLFRIIDQGDPSIGLPPYNGGLFASAAAPLLERVRLPDATIAPIVYALSHAQKKGSSERRFVNYRDMSVQQLGSIYERLLEKEPVRGDDGTISIRPNPYARKDSGSFFTPQELVDLIIDRTLKPLAEERLKAFEEKAVQLKSDRRPKAHRKTELLKLDPAEAVLNLKVLDPAMGSGHFLVTAVDFLSDYIAELIEYVPAVPEWLDGGYFSPLVERVATVRGEILRRAEESNWVLDEAQLTDQAIIRRMVLKRCIYGVDKNRLTVELAKVSLWLHSFTVGAPLSFLDHHLRCGDSLIGLRVTEAIAELKRLGGLFASSAVAGAEAATEGMLLIEDMSDADVAEVRASVALFQGVEETTAELRGLLDFLCGLRWLTAGKKKERERRFRGPFKRDARPAFGGCLPAAGQRSGRRYHQNVDWRELRLDGVQRDVGRRQVHRRTGGVPTLGGRLSGGVAPVARHPSGRRFRCRDRQPTLGSDQASGGGVVCHPRARAGSGSDRGREAGRYTAASQEGGSTRGRLRCRQGAGRQLGSYGPRVRPLSLAGTRRHQPVFAVRGAGHEPDQAGWLRRSVDAVGHIRRQDRCPIFQVCVHYRTRRWRVRLREPPAWDQSAAILPRYRLTI